MLRTGRAWTQIRPGHGVRAAWAEAAFSTQHRDHPVGVWGVQEASGISFRVGGMEHSAYGLCEVPDHALESSSGVPSLAGKFGRSS